MITLTEAQIEQTKKDMAQVASLLGYRLDKIQIAPLPNVDRRVPGWFLYWKADINGKPGGGVTNYLEGATATNVMTMLVHSVAFMITAGNRPERALIDQAIKVSQFHKTDLLSAALMDRIVTALDSVPSNVEIPTANKIFERLVSELRPDIVRTIETFRQIAIIEKRRVEGAKEKGNGNPGSVEKPE